MATECNDCKARGARCMSQEEDEPVPDARRNIKERVNYLEELVDGLLARKGYAVDDMRAALGARDGVEIHIADGYDVSAEPGDPTVSPCEDAPALSLFDNAIVSESHCKAAPV
jgi:hypothetical protein